MPFSASIEEVVAELERDRLRNVVPLKYLEAFGARCQTVLARSQAGTATLVAFPVSMSDYDRRTYPDAEQVVLITGDAPEPVIDVVRALPRDRGLVFKIADAMVAEAIGRRFTLKRTRSYLSFTSRDASPSDASVLVSETNSVAMARLFAEQDHSRAWLDPLLAEGKAFTCAWPSAEQPAGVCFAFENWQTIWEIGGVVTAQAERGRGVGRRVVQAVVAEIRRRGLTPRYQVEETNIASQRLALSAGLTQFLTLTHYLHRPTEARVAAPDRL